jgi:hypothetical protein
VEGYGIADSVVGLLCGLILGLFVSAFGFVFVHILIVAVDWVDDLLEKKPPQDQWVYDMVR